ncbi:glycosyl hydrolase family 18 protein [Vibrio sp.]|nr:glycosyl hydrolase family 18 protein [Vibrio sp.]
MSKFKYSSIATALTLATIASGMANAAPLADERFITQAEWDQRNDAQNPVAPTNKEVNLNVYQTDASKPQVSAYASNWAQYARKFNILDQAHAYDKIVASFFGICGTEIGDPAITSAVDALKRLCGLAGAQRYEVMTTDVWGDFQSLAGGAFTSGDYGNLGNPHWQVESDALQSYWFGNNPDSAGFLGALKQFKQQYPDKTVAMSIFGWSLSQLASEMVATESARTTFINSLVATLQRHTMFTQVDIDWEYPATGGAEFNIIDPLNDADNYAFLISELRSALDSNGLSHVKLAIAAPAPTSKLEAVKVKQLLDNGLDIVHLMTYDFFGIPWAETITHSANLGEYSGSDWSLEKSVKYLIEEEGVDSKAIHVGYTTYSRAAAGAEITSLSPLEGTYKTADQLGQSSGLTGGTFESGVYEWYDFEEQFLNISAQGGLQLNSDKASKGYQLYTDMDANADYFYSDDRDFYISIDTPRSTYAKAQFVEKYNLGGIFTWLADYDTGYMVNAAREGLGYQVQTQNVDMTNIIYSCGVNVADQQACQDLTNLDGETVVDPDPEPVALESNAGPNFNVTEINKAYALDGAASTGDVDRYIWRVNKVVGISEGSVVISDTGSATPTVTFTEEPAESGAYAVLRLQVRDDEANKDNDTVRVNLNIVDQTVLESNAGPNFTVDELNTAVQLNGSESTGPINKYIWKVNKAVGVDIDSVVISDRFAESPTITFTAAATEEGAYVNVRLQLRDSDNNKDNDTVRVFLDVQEVVEPEPEPQPEIAEWVWGNNGSEYQPGDLVTFEGEVYACAAHPYTGWCDGIADSGEDVTAWFGPGKSGSTHVWIKQ